MWTIKQSTQDVRSSSSLLAAYVVAVAAVIVCMAYALGQSDEAAASAFGIKIPAGYRDWKLISVAHEE